ncbi:hypothetical protein [Spirosoma sp. KUDC1026]|uniref:hypothetical protein n=1 Tax=Spirosoma sp. KUDC1026 TaxID=2745947 RepID=UPI00159BB4AE|nr:hypothetical protein [Spirosoma sp. KUDC1026]QKZ15181.1 hypothetical protein HU175_22170 [Spirosoma sp. KUDC1026]
MKQLRTNFLLMLVALVLGAILIVPGVATTLYRALRRWNNQTPSEYAAASFLAVALAIDRAGNVLCRDLFDMILVKKVGYPFGLWQDTISKVLGKNKELGALSWGGLWLANLLNAIDPNHVENAAND